MPKPKTRIEKDSMGEMRVPLDAYYGAQIRCAVGVFPISKVTEKQLKKVLDKKTVTEPGIPGKTKKKD